jgi:hypothetical protein
MLPNHFLFFDAQFTIKQNFCLELGKNTQFKQMA